MTEYLLKIDLIFMTLGWIVITYLSYKIFKKPSGLEKIEKEEKKIIAFHMYFTNYVAMLHALIIVVLGNSKYKNFMLLAFLCILKYEGDPYRELEPLEGLNLRISFSYFIVDTIFGLIKKYNDIPMHFHHFVSVACLLLCLIT